MKRKFRRAISDLKSIQSQYLLGDDLFDVAISMLMIKFLSASADTLFDELISNWISEGMPRAKAMALALDSDILFYPRGLQSWAGLNGLPEREIANTFKQICSGLNQVGVLAGLFEFKRLEEIQRYPGGALRDIVSWVEQSMKARTFVQAPELFEALLDTVLKSRFDAAISTHPMLCDLMVSLLDLTSDVYVYDPACGVGELLLETMRRAEINQIETVLCGQELREETLRVCQIRFAFKLAVSAELASGHTVLAPGHPKGSGLRTYDRVICDVPFLGAVDPHDLKHDKFRRFTVSPKADSKTRLYLSFVEHVLATMSPSGKAVLLVPASLLSGGGAEEQMREMLVESNALESAILLPKMWLSRFMSAAVIILSQPTHGAGNKNVIFVDATGYDRHGRSIMSKTVIEEVVALAKGEETAANMKSFSKEDLRLCSYLIQQDQSPYVLAKASESSLVDEIAALLETHTQLCDRMSDSLTKLSRFANYHA